MTGHLNVPSLGINSGSPTLDLSDTTTGRTRRLHHNEDLMGFLKTNGNWDMYMNNGGSMWTANYGWLYDYFFSSVANCAYFNATGNYSGGGSAMFAIMQFNLGNCHYLNDNGSQISLTGTATLTANCNCNCC